MNAQVYLVSNKLNGKQYVGQTINPHLPIGHGRIMKSAYKLHGKDNFDYEPICKGITNRATLNAVERFWIAVLDTVVPKGYNIELGGSEGSTWTEERRRKHSLALTGRIHTRPLGSKSGAKGKKWSEETKRKISETLKGRVGNNLGKKASEETRAKMSQSQRMYWNSLDTHPNTGRKHTDEWKQAASERMKKQVQSEETKKKRSESIKLWHQKRKEQLCHME